MTNAKTQIFDYADDNQELADMLLEIVKHGKADTPYDLLEMGIFNADEYYKDRVTKALGIKTFVEFTVKDLFHEKFNQKPVDFDTFWEGDRVCMARFTHWNRKVVTLRVYNTNNAKDTQYTVLTLNTWFSQKNKSYTDLCLGNMFFDPTKLRDGVHAEWAEQLCNRVGDDEWKVDDNSFKTFLGGIALLSKQLKTQGDDKLKDFAAMFA